MKKRVIFLSLFLLIVGLYLNRDILQHEFADAYTHAFSPENTEKGIYLITPNYGLKAGAYELRFRGFSRGIGSGWFLMDDSDQIVQSGDLPEFEGGVSIPVMLEGGTHNLRVGISYDPTASEVETKRTGLFSDRIPYMDSLRTHVVKTVCVLGLLVLFGSWFLFPSVWDARFPSFSSPFARKLFLILFGLTLVTSMPVLRSDTYTEGIDIYFHLSRIRGIAESLKHGYFPVRDQLFWLENYGYGCGFFYPDVFLYLPALLYLCGFSILGVYKLLWVCCTFFTLLTAALAAKRISGGKRSAAIFSAVLMAFAASRLITQFFRDGFGEALATVFLPLIVWGYYDLFTKEEKISWAFTFGVLGVVYSHMISLALAVLILAFWTLFSFRPIIKRKGIIKSLSFSFLFVLAASCFFWLPMLEQKVGVPGLKINTLLSSATGESYASFVTPFVDLFKDYFYLKFNSGDVLFIYPGLVLILLVPLTRLLLGRKARAALKVSDRMMIAGLLLYVFSTDLFPWHIFQWFLNRIQFSFRLQQPAMVLCVLSGACVLSECSERFAERKRLFTSAVVLVCALFAFPIFYGVQTITKETAFFHMQNNHIYGGEYKPIRLERPFIEKNRDRVTPSDEKVEIFDAERKGLNFRFGFSQADSQGLVHFQVPMIRYVGYQAELHPQESDFSVPLDVEGDDVGLVSVSVENCQEGIITVHYEKTRLQILSEWISVMTWLLTIFCVIRGQKRKFYA